MSNPSTKRKKEQDKKKRKRFSATKVKSLPTRKRPKIKCRKPEAVAPAPKRNEVHDNGWNQRTN